MSLLPLTFAALNYDRFRAMQDGRVRPEGIDLNFIPLQVEETFYRQLKYEEFDAAEMSLSSYVLTLNQERPPFVAIPVFPSRYFRHQTMFVNRRSGIENVEDLIGKRVGLPEYQITAGVWQRGMLGDRYGVPLEDMKYYTGGVETPGRTEKLPFRAPDGVHVQPIDADQTLSAMLAQGELDAVFSASVPSCFYEHEHVQRLFPDYKSVEKGYYRDTGIFPIMHTVVIKRDVVERDPWVARSLMKAFERSLALAGEELRYRSALMVMLPWLADHVEETREALGADYWSYGIEANAHVLDTFLRYSHEQGLAERRWRSEEIFYRSTGTSFVI